MVVRNTSLALAIVGAMGLAAGSTTAIGKMATGSEALSALVMGAVLLLLGTAARRAPVTKD